MKKVYIAIPYSSVDKIKSFELSNKVAAQEYKKGNIVYAPISHTHSVAVQEGLPTTIEFWEKVDFEFLRWCDYMVVVKMTGWDESRGVKKEMDYCKSLGKPIVYLNSPAQTILTET